ncbi:MAG: caspase family protein [Gemmatimonadetes bacterium]|nr:caspase family protein [Gemmatimonadota bacterium]
MTDHRPFSRSIAVVVGIDRYRDGIPELRTAANDARRVGAILGESHGYEVIQLLDEEATQARLTTLLTRELPEGVGPDDRVFFYWAGHGVARDGDDGPNGYLLPVDARRGDEATFLHMPLVHDALLSLTCRHMLVVLDSCFSGAFRWSGTRAAELIDDDAVIHQEKYDRFVRDPAWQVITSAAQDQKAIDQLSTGSLGSRDGDGAHSPFALALFEALDGAGDVIPRKGGDGLVTATELYLYLEERLQLAAQEAGKRQTPRLWPLRKHDKGEFVFFVPGRDLALPPAPALTFENNPWRGLASYDAADAALFFGRDAEIAALRARVEALPLTVVLGASGTGKSSLVKAGLVPRLAADGWQVLPIVRPGTTPLVALAQAVGSGDGAVAATPAATATPAAGAATATPRGHRRPRRGDGCSCRRAQGRARDRPVRGADHARAHAGRTRAGADASRAPRRGAPQHRPHHPHAPYRLRAQLRSLGLWRALARRALHRPAHVARQPARGHRAARRQAGPVLRAVGAGGVAARRGGGDTRGAPAPLVCPERDVRALCRAAERRPRHHARGL